MIVEIKKLNKEAILPMKGTFGAAGFDIYANSFAEILPGKTVLVGTGLAASIPPGYFGGIYARSGLALRQGLRPGNCVGIVDSDYRGEIKVALHNDSDEIRVIHKGYRIAQLIIQPYPEIEMIETNELSDTQRGSGGFGSTGTN